MTAGIDPANAHPVNRDHPLLPILITLAGVAMLSLMDAFMKGAALAAGVYSATWLRSVLAVLLVAPVWLTVRKAWPSRAALRLHLGRGVVSAFMALTFFYALTKLPIAEAIAISFIAPLIALHLAAILLGERVRTEAIVAALLGMAGTLVIVGGRIGRERMTEDAALGLAAILFSAVLYAYNFILIRQQSQLAGPLEVAVFHGGVSAVILGLAAPWFFALPTLSAFVDLGASAVLTVGGAMALAWAYRRAEAQALVPLEYSGFLWAALFGWLFFAEAVTLTTVLGTALIVLGCLIAARRKKPLPDAV